jgi:putative transposase
MLLALLVGVPLGWLCHPRTTDILWLRHQLAIASRGRPRPRVRKLQRLVTMVWTTLVPRLRDTLVIVSPATVLRWHASVDRWLWRLKSQPGRPATRPDLRDFIRKMAWENPTWGATRIHGELRKLGYRLSERTVSRLLPKRRTLEPGGSWATFVRNHLDTNVAMDLVTVTTAAFSHLKVLVVLSLERRKVLHFAVTATPTALWVANQLRCAFADWAPKFLIRDNDPVFLAEAKRLIDACGITTLATRPRTPRMNAFAERFIGTLRTDLLNHVIPWNQRHLERLLREYVRYYHDERTHLGLDVPVQQTTSLSS